MKRLMKKYKIPVNILAMIIFLAVNSCAAMRPGKKEPEKPIEKYRIVIINAGAYQALGDQAAMDVNSFREVHLVDGRELMDILSRAGASRRQLMESKDFSSLSAVEGIDFALVLLPSPPAYVAGSVGLHSINWRTGTIKNIPAVKVPERPADWLLEAQNGWMRFTSIPPGARVYDGERLIGYTPLVTMVDKKVFRADFKWSKKAVKSVEIRVDERNWAHARAPDKYIAKHRKGFYARAQDADEDYGEIFFIAIYMTVILASLAMLFYNPFVR